MRGSLVYMTLGNHFLKMKFNFLKHVVYMTYNIQIRELIRSVAEWREGSEQREPSRTEWSGNIL